MKKLCVIILMLVMITGCGGSNLNSLDINKASSKVEETLKNMVSIDNTTLQDVYGLDLSIIDEYVIKQNDDGDFYAIIKTTNKTAMKEDMSEYFAKVKNYNEAYSPERLELLENRLEKEVGDYLIYIIAENSSSIYNNIIDTMD